MGDAEGGGQVITAQMQRNIFAAVAGGLLLLVATDIHSEWKERGDTDHQTTRALDLIVQAQQQLVTRLENAEQRTELSFQQLYDNREKAAVFGARMTAVEQRLIALEQIIRGLVIPNDRPGDKAYPYPGAPRPAQEPSP